LPFEITVSGTGNASDVTNVTLYDEDGASVGGPLDPQASGWATITDTIIFPTGIHTYTFKADLNTDFAANDTILFKLNPPSDITARGSVTDNSITVTPSTAVSGDTVTVKAGSLSVSQASTPAAQNVIVGKTDHLFAKYILDASNSGEDVRVTQLKLRHTTSAAAIHSNITNITLYDTAITSQATCESNSDRYWDATYGCALNSGQQGESVTTSIATSTITLSNNVLVVEKGVQKTIEVRGDIAAGSANQTHAFGISDSAVTSTGADTGESLTSTYSQSHGQAMTLQTAGKLTIAKDSSWPSNKLVVAGAEKEIVGVLNLTADWEDVILTDIQFNVDAVNSGNQDEVDTVYLYNESGDMIGSLTPTSTTWLITVPESAQNSGAATINVSNTSGEKIYVKADMANIGTGYTGGAGQGFNVDVDNATDVNGKGADSSSTSITTSGTVTGNDVQIYQSIPTVTDLSVSSTLTNGSGKELYKFRVSADAAGDIGFYKATFLVTTDTATVTNFALYEINGSTETNLTYGSTYPGTYVVDTAASGGTGGQYKLEMGVDTETINWSGQEYRIVPAGGYRDFVLKGTVANSVSGSSVSVSLCGDDAAPTSYPLAASNIDGYKSDDFIWSDLNVGNSTTTATNTAEWTNGFRVSGLESTSTSVTISR